MNFAKVLKITHTWIHTHHDRRVEESGARARLSFPKIKTGTYSLHNIIFKLTCKVKCKGRECKWLLNTLIKVSSWNPPIGPEKNP
jgi:hypothetical protein